MARVIVWATAGFFVFYGLVFVAWPVEFAMFVTQSAPQSVSGMVDFRATYGGMSVAVGVILASTTSSPALTRFGLYAVVVTMLGMAAGRTIGIVVDGAPNSLMFVYLVAELVTAGAAWLLLAQSSRSGSSSVPGG